MMHAALSRAEGVTRASTKKAIQVLLSKNVDVLYSVAPVIATPTYNVN